jgi:hypothetical protein
MSILKDELIAIARNYWDSSSDALSKLEPSPERQRLHARWAWQLENMGPWNAFLGELESELPQFIIGDTLTTGDASLRCIIYPPKESRTPAANWVVVGCRSLLAPVSFVYGVECDAIGGALRNHKASFDPPPANMALPARTVAAKLEARFGRTAVPRELARTPVPLFVGFKAPPDTMLFHALFTSEPSSIP